MFITLPFELIVTIAELDFETFKRLVNAIPSFAYYVSQKKDYYLNFFTKPVIQQDFFRTVITYTLPTNVNHGPCHVTLCGNLGTISYNNYLGVKHGQQCCIINGKKYICNYVNGVLEGDSIVYLLDGSVADATTIIKKQTYKNNLLHGLQLKYYNNGKIKSIKNYNAGVKQMLQIKYN